MVIDMPIKALLMDFYGTIAHEDTVCVKQICKEISAARAIPVRFEEVMAFWWDIYHTMFSNAAGKRFITKRKIARISLEKTCASFGVDVDIDRLVNSLYRQWEAPDLFEDSKAFLAKVSVPVCIVSNSDHGDLQSAIIHNELLPDKFITSEDTKCYKPDTVIFQHALNCMSLTKKDVLYVGDSISCDIVGAKKAGLDYIWMNRDKKPVSAYMEQDKVCNSLDQLMSMNLF